MLYEKAVNAFVELIRTFPHFDYMLGKIFWHIASLIQNSDNGHVGPSTASDRGLWTYVWRFILLREGPKGIAFSQPMFAMHLLCECVVKGAELEKFARTALFFNALHVSGMQVYAGSMPPPPDTSHISPAEALSAQWAPGSAPHVFYSELAKAQRIPIPLPDFSQFDDEENSRRTEPNAEATFPQSDGPEEPSAN